MKKKIKRWPTLYTYNRAGKVQEWTIVAEDNTFYTIEGLKGGKLTTSKPTVCYAKNTGKKNETSASEQACKESAAKYQKKLDKGYGLIPNKTKSFFEPMLAEAYRDKETGEKNKWVDKTVWDSGVRLFVQPKLDGLRCINNNCTLMSREGKPFVTCPHLYQNNAILDGELYNHKFRNDFNSIVSMIKGGDTSPENLEYTKKFAQMWVYDIPGPENFSERYQKLENFFIDNPIHGFVLVPTKEIHSEAELIAAHKEYLAQGYEGTILRLDKPYENNRTRSLLKYKDFIDEEFEIVGYEEGKGGRTGTIGKFILRHDKDKDKTFKSNVKGNFDYLRQIWAERESYIGKSATVEYFHRTPLKGKKGDVPRFGTIIKIARETYE
jgi:ATP-dependent DNA ligase